MARRSGLRDALPARGHETFAIDFQLFRRGEAGRLENAYDLTWDGVRMRLFDHACVDGTASVADLAVPRRLSCALASVPAVMSPLSVTRERISTAIADSAALDDITFELEEFNLAFDVRGRPQVRERLPRPADDALPAHDGSGLLVRDAWSLVPGLRPRAAADGTPRLLDTMTGFRQHVPEVVHDLYGAAGSG